MPIATSRQYIATSYCNTIELWDPIKNIRTVHTLDDKITIAKIECYHQGGVILTKQGDVMFFDQCGQSWYPCDEPIMDISCGDREVVMVTKSGKFIKLGKRGHYLASAPPPVQISVGPAKIAYLTAGKLYIGEQHIEHPIPIVQVSVGGGHTVFLDQAGELYGFGNNYSGQLGRGIISYAPTPIQIPFFHPIKKIGTGLEHTVVLDTNGTIWITGSNSRGQLGKIETVDGCRYGFTELCTGVLDFYARGHVTVLELIQNDEIRSIGSWN